MATTEQARHRLYQRLNEVIGTDEADTLMELLPPTGWADVATRHDLTHLGEVMATRFARVDAQFEAVDRRFDQVDQRFEANDRRFDQVDQRFEAIDRRFDQVDQRFEAINRRFEQVDDKIESRFTQLDDKIETRFTQLDDKIDAHAQIGEHRLATEMAGVRTALADLRTELHRSLRVNMLVTVGVLGSLITVVGALTGGG